MLDELAGKLTTTRFYVSIHGNASTVGDLEQNKLLAERRAQAAPMPLAPPVTSSVGDSPARTGQTYQMSVRAAGRLTEALEFDNIIIRGGSGAACMADRYGRRHGRRRVPAGGA